MSREGYMANVFNDKLTSEKGFVHQNGYLSVILFSHESIRLFASRHYLLISIWKKE